MACSGKCAMCGHHYDKFNGQLVNLSDEVLQMLSRNTDYAKLIEQQTHDDKVKHFVVCADCVEGMFGITYLPRKFFKYKKGLWMTSNVAYVLRKIGKLNDITIANLKEMDDHGVVPFDRRNSLNALLIMLGAV